MCHKNCDICVLRNGKAKKTDAPIPEDYAPISGDPKRRAKKEPERLTTYLAPVVIKQNAEVLEEARSGAPEAGENEEAARHRRRRGGKSRSGKAKAAAQSEAPARQPEAKPQPEEKAQKPKAAAHRRYHRRRKGGQKPEA